MKKLFPGQAPSILLLAVVFCAFVLYPLGAAVRDSLTFDGRLTFDHYLSLLDPANTGNWEAVGNSVLVSVLSVVFSAALGALHAVVLTQCAFRFRTSLSRLAILPIALPPLVGVIAFLFVFGESGIVPRLLQKLFGMQQVPFFLDGFWAIVAVHTYSFHVYFMLFLMTALTKLDASQREAAVNLGSTPWNTFRRVLLPALRPALVGASALTFMASMASFSAPFLFGGARRFLTTQIYSTKLNGDLELAAAQSILLTLVSVVFFFVLQVSGGSALSSPAGKGVVRARPFPLRPAVRRLLVAASVVLIAIELLPMLAILVISLVREGSWTWQVLPTVFTLDNYALLFSDPRVFDPVRNSLTMTILTVGAALLVGTSGAYLITKGGLRRSRLLVDLLLTLPFAIPGTVIAINLILAFNTPTIFSAYAVLVGTFWILPIAYFVRTYPLVIRSVSAALSQVDDSVSEAGESLGAGPVRRLRKIVLPMILPGIVSGSLLVAIAALGEFVSSILLFTYDSRPISIEILSQLRGYNFGAAAAYCVVLLLLILALAVVASRLSRRPGSEVRMFDF